MKKQRVVHINNVANIGSILVDGLRHHNIKSELIKMRLKGGAYSLPIKFLLFPDCFVQWLMVTGIGLIILLFSKLDDVTKDADIAMRALAGVRL